jgi:hypothetical protein
MLATKSNSIDDMSIVRHGHDRIKIFLRSNRLVDTEEEFRRDDEILTRNVVFLDCLSYDNFGCSLGVKVCRVPGVDAPLVRVF